MKGLLIAWLIACTSMMVSCANTDISNVTIIGDSTTVLLSQSAAHYDDIYTKTGVKVVYKGKNGWTAKMHVDAGTMLDVTTDTVFINLGINSAKQNKVQMQDITTLVLQAKFMGITPALVKSNNVGVAYSPHGDWVANSAPSDWYPMDNWQNTRDNIDVVAHHFGIDVIDLGDDSGALDASLLRDSFHPSEQGLGVITSVYINYIRGLI